MDKIFHPLGFLIMGLLLFGIGILNSAATHDLMSLSYTLMFSTMAAAFVVGSAILCRR